LILIAGSALSAKTQDHLPCLIEQPLPERPEDHGSVDVETSVIFRVEFLASGRIGKVSLIRGSQITRLDELARDAVGQIRFLPKEIDGSPISTVETLSYRYSWRIPGWSIVRTRKLRPCSK
jgi:TonB family protein